MSPEKSTREVAELWFSSLDKGDFDTALTLIAEDVLWENIPPLPIEGLSRLAPWLGSYRGRQEVVDSFKVWASNSRAKAFKLLDLRVDGDVAIGIVQETAVSLATQQVYNLYVATWLKIANGRLAHWKVYWDPTPLVAAYQYDRSARLRAAVIRGDRAEAARALEVGANPNALDPQSGLSALMIAAGRGQAELVKLLLAAGGEPNLLADQAGGSALHKAALGGDVETARLLLEAGAFLDLQMPSNGHTPLMDAIWYKHVELVQFFLDRGANLSPVTYYDFDLDKFIDFAININRTGKDRLEKIKAAVIARRAADGKKIADFPLLRAAREGDRAAVEAALAAGAKVDERCPVVGGFDDGYTPLSVACRENHPEAAKALLDAGANPRARDKLFCAEPVHKAAYMGHPAVIELLAGCPAADLNVPGPINGYTPLHDALWHANIEVVRALLDAGARVDLAGHDGQRPLDIARDVLGADHELTKELEARLAAAAKGAGNDA